MNDDLSYISRSASEDKKAVNYRGPGASGQLRRLVVDNLLKGKKVVTVYNTTYTPKVRLSEKQVVPGENEFGPSLLFGSYDFTHTVGLWLPFSRSVAGHWLSPFISTDGFEFTPAEYLDLRERLDRAVRMHYRRPRMSGVLEELNTGFFRHRSLEESQIFLTQQLDEFHQQAQELFQRYNEAVNAYSRGAMFRKRKELSDREREVGQLQERLAEVPDRRQRRRRATELLTAWTDYRQRWVSEEETRKPPAREELDAELSEITTLRDDLARDQAAETLSLSPLTADPELGEAAALQALADELEELHRAIDEAGIYQLPLGGSTAATTSRQHQVLDALLQRLTRTKSHLPDLADFYAHRQFWYAQPGRLRRLLGPLEKLPTEQWADAFSGWYFDRCLEQADHPARQQLRCHELAALLTENNVLTVSDAGRIEPGGPIPPGTDLLVDMTGGDRPVGYSGDFATLRPPGDREAVHCARSGWRDPRLTLLQDFYPAGPANWNLLEVSVPPPGSNGQGAVQLTDEEGWQPLASWEITPVAHLRLFLPRSFTPADSNKLLLNFDRLLLAADKITFYYAWTPDEITQALLSDGLNAPFLAAALLRAAEACTEIPFDRTALVAVGREIQTRCGIAPLAPHPLAEGLAELLKPLLPDFFFTIHQPWRDTFLPLVLLSPAGKKTVLLPGGRLPGYTDRLTEARRQEELRVAGMDCLEIDAYACWADRIGEAGRIVEAVKG